MQQLVNKISVNQQEAKTLVVVGGGYAGVLAANRAAGRLKGRGRVILVSPGKHFVDRIRLHEAVASGFRVQRPFAELLASGVQRIDGMVTQLLHREKRLLLRREGRAEEALRYDSLILAAGSRLKVGPQVADACLALASAAHAKKAHERLQSLRPGAKVIVVGGGLTAIELASEVATRHPSLVVELVAQTLGEAWDESARAVLREELESLGVRLRLGTPVEAVQEQYLRLQGDSRLEADLCLWAGGFEASFALPSRELAQSDEGRLLVDEELRVLEEQEGWLRPVEGIFAVGDCARPPAECIGTGQARARMGCVNAMPQGAHAADQIARLWKGRALLPFRFDYAVQCMSLGRRRGLVLRVSPDDVPTGKMYRGRLGSMIKEAICRFVSGSLRLEARFSGLYAWPGARRARVKGALPAVSSQAVVR